MKNSKNRNRFMLLILLIVFSTYGTLRLAGYNNTLFDIQIEKQLEEELETEQVSILEKIKVDDLHVSLFQYESKMGISIGECIFTFLCSPESKYYGFEEQSIGDKIIRTDKGTYVIIFGYNEDNSSIINYSVDDYEYSSPLPFTEEYFIIYQEVPENTALLEVIRDVSFN